MKSVGSHPISTGFGVYTGSTGLGVFQGFQDHNPSPLAHHKPATVLVKRPASLFRVFVEIHAEGVHIAKTRVSQLSDTGFRSARDDHVRFSLLNPSHGFTDAVGPRSASGNRGGVRALGLQVNGGHAGSHIDDHHWNKK